MPKYVIYIKPTKDPKKRDAVKIVRYRFKYPQPGQQISEDTAIMLRKKYKSVEIIEAKTKLDAKRKAVMKGFI